MSDGPRRTGSRVGGGFEARRHSTGAGIALEALTRGCAGTWTPSGRVGLYLLLRELKQSAGIEQVQLPAFLCQSLVQAAEASGLLVDFYPVLADLSCEPDPGANSVSLVVHYFGHLNPLVEQSGPWIEDFSMAVSSGDSAPLHPWFFSIRKIGPAPLGGWCSVAVELGATRPADRVQRIAEEAALSKWRYLHTKGEADLAREEAYVQGFDLVEEALDRLPWHTGLPERSLGLIKALNLESIKRRRRANWKQLDRLCGDRVERLMPEPAAGEVPLAYVIRLPVERRDQIRSGLASRGVYCPVHWPRPAVVDAQRFPDADILSRTLLSLPIDQRYGETDMEFLAEQLAATLGNR